MQWNDVQNVNLSHLITNISQSSYLLKQTFANNVIVVTSRYVYFYDKNEIIAQIIIIVVILIMHLHTKHESQVFYLLFPYFYLTLASNYRNILIPCKVDFWKLLHRLAINIWCLPRSTSLIRSVACQSMSKQSYLKAIFPIVVK